MATNIYLNAAGQTQLNQLKQANQVPITRLNASKATVTAKDAPLKNIKTNIDELKTAAKNISSATATPEEQKAAVQKFISEFNDVQKLLKGTSEKTNPLRGISELRDATLKLRSPLMDTTTVEEFKKAGIKTTRDGLEFTGSVDELPSAEVLEKILSTVDLVAQRVDSAKSRNDARVKRFDDELVRVQARVEQQNIRTEKNFMQYYQLMQAMGSATGNTGQSWFA